MLGAGFGEGGGNGKGGLDWVSLRPRERRRSRGEVLDVGCRMEGAQRLESGGKISEFDSL